MAFFNARIKELEGLLQAATEQRDALQANVDELTQANTDFNARHEADKAQIAAMDVVTKERDQLKADLAALQESKEAEVKAEVNKRLASVGGDAIKRDSNTVASDEELYERFQAAGPVESQALMSDPATAARIRAEGARRTRKNQ